MKTLQGVDAVQKVRRLVKVNEQRKLLEKEEKELKEFFKGKLEGEDGSLKVDRFLITVETKTSKSIDKKALAAELGDRIHDFEKESSYQQLEVKVA